MKKQNRDSNKKKSRCKLRIDPKTATIWGLVLAAIALIPAFWGLLSSKTILEVFSGQSSTPVKIEFISKYSGYNLIAFFPPVTLPSQVDYEKLDYMSLPMYNNVTFSVTNISDETIVLSKELPVHLIDYQPHPDNVDLLVVGAGGGGGYRNFVVDIPPSISDGSVKAVFVEMLSTGQTISDVNTKEVIDFFTLTPGEVEVFSVEVRFGDSGSYTFQVGVEYYRDGNVVPVWAPENMFALVPQNVTIWDMPSPTDKDEFIYREKCSYAYPTNSTNVFHRVYECNK